MEYNYILFDHMGDYYRIARRDIEQLPNCKVRTRNLEGNKVKRLLFRAHTSQFINKHIKLPFQSLWCKSYIGELAFPEDKPLCFIFTEGTGGVPYQIHLFEYLRKNYRDCKMVLWLRDKMSVAERLNPNFNIDEAKLIFDQIYTINTIDAVRYGIESVPSTCSYYPVEVASKEDEVDVVFIGAVKDRMDIIQKAYIKFASAGLRCDFLLVHKTQIDDLPEGMIVQSQGIPYEEMLRRTMKARCILEVTQQGTDALTSRCLEALCYNKKLISDNFRLTETKFYNPDYIFLYTDIEEVDPEFIKREVKVDYCYNGEFSPLRILETIEKDLRR